MATGKTTRFEELAKLATDFVTTKKGLWDHGAWMDFMSGVQAKGFDLSGNMQTNLGEMLEALKRFYAAAATTESVENAMQAVVDDSVAFVKRHQGVWGHAEWEDFVRTVERNTFNLSEGATAYLGGILESIRILYALSPVAMVQKHLSSARAQTPTASPQPASSTEENAKPAEAKTPPEPKAAAKSATETPVKQDDLTAIDGIGPALAKKLHGEGISSYAQLAALSDDDIERLGKNIIQFPGRIERDDWVGQAKAFVRGRS